MGTGRGLPARAGMHCSRMCQTTPEKRGCCFGREHRLVDARVPQAGGALSQGETGYRPSLNVCWAPVLTGLSVRRRVESPHSPASTL